MTNNKRYCVIMAGGVGSRFWPMSRRERPKQFMDILGTGRSFLRHTFERFLPIIPIENFLVVTNEAYAKQVLAEIPELRPEQILSEPLGRNTAPCIAYAAFRVAATAPDATMIVTPSDHLILDEELFRSEMERCVDFASQTGSLLTVGISPTRPDTGYGYIQVGAPAEQPGFQRVKTFTEKPNAQLARAFVESGEFFWNSGIFIWRADAILGELRTHLLDTYELFASAEGCYGTPAEEANIARIYSELRGTSIDYGVMEKSSKVFVRCSNFGWSDIGTWGSLYQYAQKDDDGNAAADNQLLAFDTHNCLVRLPKNKMAVIEGLEDYIVVDTDDVLMICPKSNEQDIKKFIATVRYTTGDKFI